MGCVTWPPTAFYAQWLTRQYDSEFRIIVSHCLIVSHIPDPVLEEFGEAISDTTH